MNETLNTNYYLFLKQQIVMFEALVVKASITVDGTTIELDNLRTSIRNTVERIEFDMTPPIILLEGRKTPLDIQDFVEQVLENVEKATKDLVDLNADQEKVRDLIYHYPDLQRFEGKLKETEPQENSRDTVVRLIAASQMLLNTVNDWVGSRRYEGRGSFQDMLFLVNWVEMIDFFFEYTNEKFGA